MGFDNECILNIQSLAGEYFCPVCRLLVYPNEALQSQCTHLYCKPCLTYIVSTTQACPYDGYLVTEADSKPLIESNKGLAETIGKITVHCLFHRSGCTWQGPLSECTSHCSGCVFGNSPVVCNRCGIQIVHRQVQEHAQNCPGVQQPQSQQVDGAQDAAAAGTPATGDQSQAPAQAGLTTSQVQTQTTATPPTGKEASQQANSNSQPQTVAPAAVPTADQWYLQQQQYQQYYQQYPGYNAYQHPYQQYYPYQQQAVPQYQQHHLQAQPQGYMQPQAQSQLQPQMQPQPQVQALPQPQLLASQPPVQAPVIAQPQNQSQVNPQQQTHPLPHSHPLPQPQSYPQVQPHPQPHPVQQQSQPMHMPQYQQPLSQVPMQLQIQYPVPQPQPQPQPQSHSQTQQQTQVQHQPQPHSQNHPQLHPLPHNQTQNPNTAVHAVTGYHSYPQPQPQPQPHQQMPFSGPPQHPMHLHPHGGAHFQVQNQFPQQNSQLRPPQSHATIPTLLPPPVQPPNITGAQQPPAHSHAAQPGVPGNQRPVLQPVQQPIPQQSGALQPIAGQPQQGPFAQQQPPLQSQLRPQNPPHSFQQHSQTYSQPQHNIGLLHVMQSHQPQILVGQPMTTNHVIQPQPYQQPATGMPSRPSHSGLNETLSNQGNILGTNNRMQLSSEQQSASVLKPSMSEKQDIAEKSVDEKAAESSSKKTAKNDATSGPHTAGIKIPKSETDVKSREEEILAEVEEKTNPVDTSEKEFVTDPVSDQAENSEPVIKQMVKEEVIENAEDHKDSVNIDLKQVGNSLLEKKEIQDSPPPKTSPLPEAAQLGEQSGKLQTGKSLLQAKGAPPGPGFVPSAGQVQSGCFVQSPPIQQRPAAPPLSQAPTPGPAHHTQAHGNLLNQFRPQGYCHLLHPGQPLIPPENFQPHMVKPHGPEVPPVGVASSASAASFGRGLGHHGPPHHSFEPPIAPQGPYNQGHLPPTHAGPPRMSQGDPVGGLTMRTIPLSAFDSHGGMMAGPPYVAEGQIGKQHSVNPMELEIFSGQRPGYLEGRQPDSHLPGSVERSPLGKPPGIQSNLMRMNGAPGLELQDERFKHFPDERLNPFQMDPSRRVIDRGEFEEDLKQLPRASHLDTEPSKLGSFFPSSRPLDRGSLGFGMDVGLRPYDKGLNHDPGLKLDPMAGCAPSRYFPSYAGERPVGLHEDLAMRSDSGRTHSDFLGPGPGYGRRHPMGGSSPRSPVREYPGISSRGFGGHPGNLGSSRLGLDDVDGREFHRFDDPIGNSFHEGRFPVFPSHLRRGEFEGPGRSGNLVGQDFRPSHLRRGETVGFGGFPGHARMGDLGGPGTFPHPRLGEPGFRSSFSHQGFPNDGGIYGDMESFENSRKRKPPSMGWCRICEVDCETVEGLDLHSQTREHQKMALDMVVTIKQNAKKQKLTSNNRTTRDDANKSRNTSLEGRGKKH